MENKVVIKGQKNFYLPHIFECGQCFRWQRRADASYVGVANKKALRVAQEGEQITFFCSPEEFYSVWQNYFDLQTDYGAVKRAICRDEVMERALSFGWGIRVLRQEFWEVLLSFLISQQSNIPKIKQVISRLCENWGDKILYEGETHYTFPDAKALSGVTEAEFAEIGAGYRAKYLKSAVSAAESGQIDAARLCRLPAKEAQAELLKLYGVGPKVADCVLLFGLYKTGAFPMDVWMKRVMAEHYAGGDGGLFGRYGGFAQQYLFYWRRSQGLPEQA